MKSDKKDCAPGTILKNWNSIDWNKVKRSVKSLQLRIAKATLVYCRVSASWRTPFESLSRMMGNYQVRFLGDKGGATRLSYPTKTRTD